MSKLLHLTLKKQWFDMIISGEKKEEYREIKPYWFGRLVRTSRSFNLDKLCERFKTDSPIAVKEDILITSSFHFMCPELIEFRNGYGKDAPSMIVECIKFGIGKGNKQLGAPDQNCFIFWLGDIIEIKNI